MNEVLWKPKSINATRMKALIKRVNEKFGENISSYADLHNWSINNLSKFWSLVWIDCDIIHSSVYDEVINDIEKMPHAKWFEGSKLNFAENLLRYRDEKIAIRFLSENQKPLSISYKDLFREVEKLAHSLRNMGIKKGDRIVGYMPNYPETIIAMLATTSIGAIWSSCSPDFGSKGALDRFIQIDPKVIFSTTSYSYNGKLIDLSKRVSEIVNQLKSLEKVVLIGDKFNSANLNINQSVFYSNFISNDCNSLSFEQLPFDHPLYIMYSSGTTGPPKSIIHSSGGTLIQHVKELHYHCDLRREDSIFYFTTCGWMMWNWLTSALAVGSTIILYDGSPFYPNGESLWQMADELKISIFGTSAKFIDSSRRKGIAPSEFACLTNLRLILSTGSPLTEENFDYVYNKIKGDVQLGSISGGTDIISCFALSNPILPVHRGQLQSIGLGMDVHSFDDNGNSLTDQKGELVCSSPFPSMPIGFWNDKDNKKYFDTYFSKYSGVWHHGDFIRISKNGSVKIFGRSDSTLNPGGVRIGTSEIYRVVNFIDCVDDSLAIDFENDGNQNIVLFVKLKSNAELTKGLAILLKEVINRDCSPKHVPDIILRVEQIPYTVNGKKVEVAVKKIFSGQKVENMVSLNNPEALIEYYELYKKLI